MLYCVLLILRDLNFLMFFSLDFRCIVTARIPHITIPSELGMIDAPEYYYYPTNSRRERNIRAHSIPFLLSLDLGLVIWIKATKIRWKCLYFSEWMKLSFILSVFLKPIAFICALSDQVSQISRMGRNVLIWQLILDFFLSSEITVEVSGPSESDQA